MQDEKRVVLDSSVIVALHFPEPFSDWSEGIIDSYEEFYIVDIAYAEVANVAWKRAYLFKNPLDQVLENLDKAIQFIESLCVTIRIKDIILEATKIAVDLGLPVYDALFLSLAEKYEAPLATLYKTLINKLSDTKYY